MRTCARCGREEADDARFCAGCGAPLAEHALQEERKVVTIVFADLVGSTARAEQLDPEDVRALLAGYHSRLRAELERYGGTVEKFIGDAVVAVFGAPLVHEDDAERAVRAALAIREATAGSDVSLRIAVNTGEALVTLDARSDRGEGMVAGDVINTAARLQSAAPVDGILVGEATYRATAHVIEYAVAEPVVAKGKREPIPVWEAVAPRSRFGVDVDESPLTELVGRRRELGMLQDALVRVRGGRAPELVTLVGVPGIGKSRLVAELFRFVDADPDLITWRQGRCLPYGEGISYWALGEMAKAQAGVLETDSAVETQQKVVAAVGALVPDAGEAAWVVSHLRPLVGLQSELPGSADGRGEAFAAWRRFLEALAEEGPTVLVFEDLHWADDGLLDFVDGLVERTTGVPLLVVCSARPELLTRRPGWGGGKANAVTLSLSPLTDDDTARLVSGLLAQAVLPAEMQQALLAHAEGNPLFAEEYIRMLRDRGLLRREGDLWRLDADQVEVPGTVQGIIAARLDALTASEKRLLQAASVVGKVFWTSAAAAIAEIEVSEAEELLHALERKELVRRDRRASVAREVEFAFRHVLTRDVAYGQIPRAGRAEQHRRAAAWIEDLADERSEDRAELLAHHYVAALELARAAGAETGLLEERARLALREAGDRAYALSALGPAARFYRAALELWPDGEGEGRTYLLLDLGRVLAVHGADEREELEQAVGALLQLGDFEAASEAEGLLGDITWLAGAREEARAHYDRAAALVADLPPTRTTITVLVARWRFLVLADAHPPLEEGERILALAESNGSIQEILHARINLGVQRNRSGDPSGMTDLETALRQAQQANSHLVARAYTNLASFTGTLGDLHRARELHREGLSAARRFGSNLERWLVAECIQDDFQAGDWDDALAAARAFVTETETSPHYMEAVARWALAHAAVARGERPVALAESARALSLGREIGDAQMLGPCLAHRAWAAHECGEPAIAAAGLDELSSVLDEARSPYIEFGIIEGFVAAEALGVGTALAEQLARAVTLRTPWVEVCERIAASDLIGAADELAGRGAVSYSAYLRLVAAEREGRDVPELGEAIAFFERVGASAYLARAVSLLQASA